MTDTRTYADLDICSSCLMVLANGPQQGENYADDLRAAEGLAHNWPGWDITLGALDEECEHCKSWRESGEEGDNPCDEGWFSWSSCQGCGSRLGGQRYHATAWKEGD